MKTYALQNISSCERAATELRAHLPGQQRPWLLRAFDGDVVAYFNVLPEKEGSEWRGHCVTADISGRHYTEDLAVISVLQRLQPVVGGEVTDDNSSTV